MRKTYRAYTPFGICRSGEETAARSTPHSQLNPLDTVDIIICFDKSTTIRRNFHSVNTVFYTKYFSKTGPGIFFLQP